jgi:hypothetical protein
MQIGLATLILDGLSLIMYFLLVAMSFHAKSKQPIVVIS